MSDGALVPAIGDAVGPNSPPVLGCVVGSPPLPLGSAVACVGSAIGGRATGGKDNGGSVVGKTILSDGAVVPGARDPPAGVGAKVKPAVGSVVG